MSHAPEKRAFTSTGVLLLVSALSCSKNASGEQPVNETAFADGSSNTTGSPTSDGLPPDPAGTHSSSAGSSTASDDDAGADPPDEPLTSSTDDSSAAKAVDAGALSAEPDTGRPVGSSSETGEPIQPIEGNPLARILVSAGELARDHSIVSFPSPSPELQGKNARLDDGHGNSIPVQINPVTGDLVFVLPSLGVGEQALLTLVEVPEESTDDITVAIEGDQLAIEQRQIPMFGWTLAVRNVERTMATRFWENENRAGYIYPLFSPSGLNVTDDYPVDHPSDHGIWSAWMRTTFREHAVDFFNGFSEQGHVDLESMGATWSGPVVAGFVANLRHTDITTTPSVDAIAETWTVTAYKTHDDVTPYFIFDIESVQQTAGEDPVVVEQYHLGGFNFRGAPDWQVYTGADILTSEGNDLSDLDLTTARARWCALFGQLGEQSAGFAALGHPDNYRHPHALHVNQANPRFSFLPVAPISGGRFTMTVGKPYTTRFRVVTFDGPADPALLDRLWDDYAKPVSVTLAP